MTRRRLLIFAKAPVAGRVKTRLAGRWGAAGACRIYKALLRRTVATAASVRACVAEIHCAGSHPYLRSLARRHGMALRTQAPGDLGRRMQFAFRYTAIADGPTVIIGGDCAALTAGMIEDAFGMLEAGAGLVLGPALDGGYVLIGQRGAEAGLMRAVDWGTARVLDQTLQRARRLDLPVGLLKPVPDVDRPEDVKRLRRSGRLPVW